MLNIQAADFRTLKEIYKDTGWFGIIAEAREAFSFTSKVFVSVTDGWGPLSTLLGTPFPDWVTGVSFGSHIAVLSEDARPQKDDTALWQLIVHEFVHIAVDRTARAVCPKWISEGLAMHFAKQSPKAGRLPAEPEFLSEFTPEFPCLYSLDYTDADRLYNLSWLAIGNLIKTHGLKAIVKRLASVKDFFTDEIFGEAHLKGGERQ
jgi:hypothetical protein